MPGEGKRWGIIGLGAIGSRVATIATAFGAEVVYYSTSGKNNNNIYKRVDLDELLTTCDIISIHAPLNENTEGLMNYSNLSKMKKNAILINMGRGPIVVDEDLAKISPYEIELLTVPLSMLIAIPATISELSSALHLIVPEL